MKIRFPFPLFAALLTLVAASGWAAQPPSGVGSDGIFRITPQRPVPELRAEALAAQPPAEPGQFRSVDLVELIKLDPTIKLDIRYATTNNFLSTPVYTRPAAYLQRPAADALRARPPLTCQSGLRPVDPRCISTLVGHESFLGSNAAETAGIRCRSGPGLTTQSRLRGRPDALRPAHGQGALDAERLRRNDAARISKLRRRHACRARASRTAATAMEHEGFSVYETEWWHFDFKDWREYPIVNKDF